MNSKFIKGLIISIILVIIITIITLLVILNNKENQDFQKFFTEGDEGEELNLDRHNVIDKSMYYTVRNCIDEYLDALNKKSTSFLIDDEYDDFLEQDLVYNLLSSNYIKKNNITEDNVLNKVNLYNEKMFFLPIKMQVIESNNTFKYLSYGYIINIDNKYIDDLYIIINIDYANKTFNVEPLENKYNDINDIKFNNENEVVKANNYNSFILPNVNNEYITNEYILLYKMLSIAKPEIIYNAMPKAYREKRFGNIEDYKAYVQDNKDEISTIFLSEYLVNYNDDNMEYVGKDQYGNLYIFLEDENMNYTITLDTYTIESEDFLEKYEKGTNQEKMALNIDKFFKMINAKDYKSAYELLDKDFKDTYFKTESQFEEYARQTFYRYNEIVYSNYVDNISSVFKYDLLVKNKLDNSQKFGMSVVMQFNEGTNFTMAFGGN